MARRSPWGSVRRLASGRYQARYRLDGQEFVAPGTFRTKRDADAFLAHVRADVERGTWVNPEAGRICTPWPTPSSRATAPLSS